ncbi:plastocyanin/azurin family copper-binding protein [Halostagnicola sp. A-GB9-2]|uniref:cupredoxin domain-containing protein n=1 Tax=Halostagnicola sp. A-GB9-2 TaxID=3048066 RepID=UPI0024BF5C83|nr:plastocyanin/azurin family copper-binding protein [Halostagnicola sp. A-GB9-2]MDJ1434128.1 plastocyanin/azurin family copper-binding protein [Halostagnicola sp. A-GB9-2]
MTNDNSHDQLTRRGVLKGTAAAAGTAAITGTAGAYREHLNEPLPAVQNDVDGRTFTLLGIVSGWIGVAPAEIDGQSGPTLRLLEGEEHEVIWVNGDGSHHNFVLADDEGDALEATPMLDEQGEFEELTFTAESEMAEYYCEPHPVQMRGPIEVVDPDEVHELHVHVEDSDGDPIEAEVFLEDMHSFSDIAARPDPDEDFEPARARFDMLEDGDYELEVWTYGHERVTEEVTIDGGDEDVSIELPAIETGDPVETYSLTLQEGEWVGEAPDEIADEANPTLEFEAGETYAVEWENGIGQLEDEEWGEPLPGHNFVVASGGDTNEWNTYVRSEFIDEAGENQTVEFVAEEEMEVYLDQSQHDAVGDVVVE